MPDEHPTISRGWMIAGAVGAYFSLVAMASGLIYQAGEIKGTFAERFDQLTQRMNRQDDTLRDVARAAEQTQNDVSRIAGKLEGTSAPVKHAELERQ